jgi:hypothetical protein
LSIASGGQQKLKKATVFVDHLVCTQMPNLELYYNIDCSEDNGQYSQPRSYLDEVCSVGDIINASPFPLWFVTSCHMWNMNLSVPCPNEMNSPSLTLKTSTNS